MTAGCNTTVESDIGELLALLVSNTDEAIMCVECSGHTVVLFNGGAERVFGYTAGEILGKHVSAIVPVQERKEKRVQTVGTRKDGTQFPLELVISTVDMNGKQYCAVIARELDVVNLTELAHYRKTVKQQLLKEMDSIADLKLASRT